MSAKDDLTIPLLPNRYYHIYNRGINRCDIYFYPENYKYFLRKYSEKLSGYFDTFGYCLLSNHFHLMVKVKPISELFEKAIIDFDHVNETFYKEYVLPLITRIGVSSSDLGNREDLTREDLTNFKNLLNLSATYGDTHPETQGEIYNLDEADFRTQLASWVVSERFRGFLLGYAKAINKQESRTGSLFQKGFRRKSISDDGPNRKSALMYIHHNPIHHFYSNDYQEYTWSSYNAYISDKPSKIWKDEALKWFGGIDGFSVYAENYRTAKRSEFEWMINEES